MISPVAAIVSKAVTTLLIMQLPPALRVAVDALIRALLEGDEPAERRALEAARREAFIARQRK